ncbi:MAG: cytochrome P450 [Myxococcota bacterium]
MNDVTNERPLPPRRPSLPLVGETIEFVRDPLGFVARRREQFGSVFQARVLGMRLVALLGPEASRFIFANEGKVLRNKWSPAILRLLGAQSMAMLVGDAHRARRRVLGPHFRRAGMGPWVEPIVRVSEEHLRRWAEHEGETVAVDRFKRLAFEVAARHIFGELDALDLPRLSADFDHWVEGMFVPLPWRIPGTAFARAMSARERLFAAIGAEVERRAGRPQTGVDVLGTLLELRDEDGQPLPHTTIVDEIQLLMFAGHDTTVTALTNVLVHLLQHPEVLAEARAEQDARGDAPFDLDALRSMPVLESVLNESMRVVPPIGGAFREFIADTEYGGFRLRRGMVALMSPSGAHRDESVWPEPERFDPSRWRAPRAEHEQHPFAFIAFGGGPRRCIGEHFAMIQMQIVLAKLLREYDWALADGQDLRYRYLPFPRPRSGLRLRMQARLVGEG